MKKRKTPPFVHVPTNKRVKSTTVPSGSISGVQFGIFTSAEIKQLAAIRVENSTVNKHGVVKSLGVNDAHLGTTTRHMLCSTCGNTEELCPGHFGYIRLKEPVVNVEFLPYLTKVLSSVCFWCSRLLIRDHPARVAKVTSSSKPLNTIYDISRKLNRCPSPDCGRLLPNFVKQDVYVQAEFNLTPEQFEAMKRDPGSIPMVTPSALYDLLKCIDPSDVALMGLDPVHAPPISYLWKNLLVPPCAIRPSRNMSSSMKICMEDDLTIRLRAITKANNEYSVQHVNLALYRVQNGPPLYFSPGKGFASVQYKAFGSYMDLQRMVACYSDVKHQTSSNRAQYGKERDSLIQRFTSTKAKKARVRNNIFGKRMNYTARTVITPDTHIDIDCVGVPQWMCRVLGIREKVTAFSITRLTAAVRNGPGVYPGANFVLDGVSGARVDLKFVDRYGLCLKIGDTVERHLLRDDWVLFNRQPSLHKMSLMAHRVVPMQGNTFRLHVGVTKPYNADFDGDEMNLSVLMDPMSIAEGRELLAVCHNVVKDGTPLVSFQQHALLGAYLMCQEGTRLRRSVVHQLVAQTQGLVDQQRLQTAPWTVPSPEGEPTLTGKQVFSLCLPPDLFCVRGGLVVERGQIVKGEVNKDTLNNGVLLVIAKEYSATFTGNFLTGAQRLCEDYLMVTGCSLGTDDCFVPKTKEGRAMISKAVGYAESFPDHDPVDTLSPEDTAREEGICLVLDRCRDVLGDIAVQSNARRGSGLHHMVRSGSKGNQTNIVQIGGIVGQQRNHLSTRISAGTHRRLDLACASGFITHSFSEGLNSEEYFSHLIGTRVGLVDTAVKTSETGYCQRKIGKAMEDIVVAQDLSVRDSACHIVQFRYAHDGFDSNYLEKTTIGFLQLSTHTEIVKQYALDWVHTSLGPRDLVAVVRLFPELTRLFRLRDQWEALRGNCSPQFLFPVSFTRLLLPYAGQGVREGQRRVLGVFSPAECNAMVSLVYQGWVQQGLLAPNPQNECIVFGSLTSRTVLGEHGCSREQLKEVLDRATEILTRFLVTPGEHVGLQASQNCSEPLTQMTLNRFHFSGQKSSCVNGVTRTREILHVNRTISAPSMVIPTACADAASAEILASKMTELNLVDLLQQWRCGSQVPPRVQGFLSKWKRWRNVPTERLRCLEMCLDRQRCIAVRLHPFDVATAIGGALQDHPGLEAVYERLSFSNSSETDWWVSITFDTQEDIWVQTAGQLHALNDDAVTGLLYRRFFASCGLPLSGMAGITDFFVKEEPGQKFTIHTQGSNLEELLTMAKTEDLDLTMTECNHVAQVLTVLGIDAAQVCMERELEKVMGIDRNHVSSRHVQLIVANICSKGAIAPITYQGLCTGNSSVMKRASFEKAVDSFITGAVTGQRDSVKTVSDSLTWNAPLDCGTGRVRFVEEPAYASPKPLQTSNTVRVADYTPPVDITKYIYRSQHVVQRDSVCLFTSVPRPVPSSVQTVEEKPIQDEKIVHFSKGAKFIPSSPRPDAVYHFCGPTARFIPYSP